MVDKLVSQTIKASLVVQIFTTLVTLDGIRLKLLPQDMILKEILTIEILVQLVEGFFYYWVIGAVKDMDKMTPRRYIDWSITTPIMLFSTILFFKYAEKNEKGINEGFTAKQFYESNKENVHKIFVYNGLMLLFGYLGETGVLDRSISIPIGFIFFFLSFRLIYYEYAVHSELAQILFKILITLWSLYGVAAMLPNNYKNISYNMLDIVSKNFYGLYIYYKIRQLHVS